MRIAVAFAVGLLFAAGLGLSGMTQPDKVIGFLDFFGAWDPTLAFVMAGAVTVYLVTHRWLRGASPVLAQRFQLPERKDIDGRLLGGAVLFGVGWGLSGFCPGPALTSLGDASTGALMFVVAMVAGMGLFELVERSRAPTDG